ncbi:SET and MYND domain-containing protein 4 isoform X1 [Octopus sinensis]|uniref:Protein-lysine N-methyltransferase SMYD4 n=1 Tax=Octopus sinensis TaxID=2607531 RepID=A0A6P7SEC0_9MOLL|nr:SET and MYND domain-containing protein 4 isoform X1 [Octopus sinensis]
MASKIGNWQIALDNIIEEFDKDGSLEYFRTLTSNQNRIEFILNKNIILNIPWISAYLENADKLHLKSDKKSVAARQNGNKAFQAKNFAVALEHYTKSLTLAPLTSDDLALSYSNRSAALFHLGKYQACIADIEEVKQCSCVPAHLPSRLSLRKAQCLFYLQRYKEAKTELQDGMKNLQQKTYDDPKKKESLLSDFEKWLKKVETKFDLELTNDITSTHLLDTDNVCEPCTKVSYVTNSVVTCASSAVELQDNSSLGRHLRAKHPLKAGDVLIVEKPYAAILLPDYYLSHCNYCLDELVSPVPCQRCCHVLYCSRICRQQDWSSCHYVECYFLKLLHSVGIAHLSLRIILVTGLQYLLDFKENHTKDTPPSGIDGLTDAGCYETNYLSVYKLMTHSTDIPAEDQLQYSMTAVLLLHILNQSGWFQEKYTVQQILDNYDNKAKESHLLWSEPHRYVGAVLLHHIQQLICNAHAITKLDFSDPRPTTVNDGVSIQTTSQVRLATAVYPTVSLLNHSCQPSISLSFQKDTLVVRSVKDISEGKEVFSCYGPHSFRMDFAERQQILKDQYFFKCQCEACILEGSHRPSASDEDCYQCFSQLPCENAKEHTKSALLGEANNFKKALTLLESNNIEDALATFRLCADLRKRLLAHHTKDYGEIQDCIARCLASLGKYKEACKVLESSLTITEDCYGSGSLELARELQKFCELLYIAGERKKALKTINRAKSLFAIHFGLKCPEYGELALLESKLHLQK